MTVLAVLTVWAVLESTLPSFLFLLPNTVPRASPDGFDGFGGCGGFGRDGYPLKLNPLFRHPGRYSKVIA